VRDRLRQLPLLPITAVAVALLGPFAVWGAAAVGFGQLDVGRAVCAAALLLLLALAWPVTERWPKAKRGLLIAFGAVALLSSVLTVDVSLRRHFGTPRQVSTWNFFHYYLGGKYFAEVGYDGLYIEALKADQLGKKHFKAVSQYRDMKTYRMKSASKVRKAPPREAWTKERWKEFRRDVASIGRLENRRFWNMPLRDRGYNPPPGWTLLGGSLCKLLDPRSPLQSGILMWVDPALMLLAFLFSARTYGFVRSAVVLSGLALWIGTHRLFGGKVVQYDWLAAVWASMCCVRREQWGSAGALAAYATSVRIFPGALMLGPAAVAAWYVVRERRWPAHFTRFFGAGVLTLGLLVAVSGVASGRGLGSWKEFVEKNSIHQHEHKFSETRIGIPFLSTTSVESGISSSVSRGTREENYHANAGLRIAAQLLLVGLVVAAARRIDLHDAMILSLALIFALAVSSRYYGAMYGLVLLLGAPLASRAQPFRGRWLDVAFGTVLLFGYGPLLIGEDPRSIYVLSNFGLLAFFLAALLAHAVLRRRLDTVPPRVPSLSPSSG
jgi:hypothetical protein